MATRNGTITGVQLLGAPPGGAGAASKVFLITADFPVAYTGSGDSATITGVNTAIGLAERNGKTLTLRSAARAWAGLDGAAQAVYADTTITLTNTTTTGDLAFDLADAGGTEVTSTTAPLVGVAVVVVVDEA